MGKTSLLAPGFGFHPTDVVLVMYYLKRKVMGRRLHIEAIAEVDIYKFDPWDLPDKSLLKGGDLKWYFFCPVEKKYSSGARMNRATEFGYWKTSGKDRTVHYNKELVGLIKTLIFHRGKAPRGDRTDWVMHEYRLEDKNLAERGVVQNTYVLCMVFQKEGMGPRNGAQYGAPFNEEDWNDDEQVDCVETGPPADFFTPNYVPPTNCISSVAIGTSFLGGTDSESCLSETMRARICTSDVVYQASGDGDILPEVLANVGDDILPLLASFTENNPLISIEDNILPEVLANSDDDILPLLASFTEDDTLISIEDDKNKDLSHGNAEPELYSGVDNFHNDLGDVGNMFRRTEDGSQAVHVNHHFKTTDLPQPVDIFLNFC